MHNSVAKKLFAVGTALATVAGAVAPLAALAAPHSAGTNVKTSDGTIWMITSEGTRRAYTSGGAFLSYGFNSFASVVDANSDDLALPTGSFIPPQDGKVFCATETKGTDVAGECALITGGQKASFTSAAVFTGLGFSFSRAQYGDSSFLPKTTNIDNTTDAHRPGVLINNGGTVQLRGPSSNLGIPDVSTFNSWGYSFADVVPSNAADRGITQAGIMQSRVAGQLSPSFTANPGNPVVTGPVSASLASDSPAASTLVTGSAITPVARFAFSGNGTVTEVKLKRIGVSNNDTLSNVYLFDGNTRITDAVSFNSNGEATFANASGLFTVSGSKTVTVRADVATNTAGQTVGVQLISYSVAGGSAMTASLSAATHTIADATLASASFGSITPSASTIDPSNDVVVWEGTLTVSTRDVRFGRMALRQTNSINSGDIRNFRLFVNGAQVAQTQSLDSQGYVTFVPSSPVLLTTGGRNFRVLADIVGGSSRKVTMSLRNKADIDLVDSQFGANIALGGTLPATAGDLTIRSGTMSVQKATDSPSGNVTLAASDVVLGKWTLTAYGEAVKVETLKFYATSSDTSVTTLRNARVMINGAQYGSTTALGNQDATTTYTTNYTVQPGTPVTVELRADVHENTSSSDITDGDSLTVYMVAGSSNAQAQVSAETLSIPSSNTVANTVTVAQGSMSLSKQSNYTAQTTVVPRTAYKIAGFNLVGGSTEDVTVNTLTVAFATTTGTSFAAADDLNNVYLTIGGVAQQVKPTVSHSGNTWSVNYTLAKNSTVAVEIFADVKSSITSGHDFNATLAVSGTTVSSAQSVSVSATTGQVITVGSGSITATKDASSPVAALVDDASTRSVASYKFEAVSDQFTITEVVLSLPTSSTVSNIILKDGSTTLATRPAGASTTITGLNVVIPANSSKVLTVDLEFGSVGTGAGSSGEQVRVQLHSAKANSSGGTETTVTVSSGQANTMYVFKAVPTVTLAALPSTNLSNGTNTLFRYTVSAGSTGTINWKKTSFNVSTSSATTASYQLVDADTGLAVDGTFTVSGSTVSFVATDEQAVSGSKTYSLRATVTGAAADSSVTTYIPQGQSSFTMPSTYSAATTTGASFVWSDVSATSHGTGTADWNGDYLVRTIPSDAQSLSW